MIPQDPAMVKQAFPPESNKAFIPFGPATGLSAGARTDPRRRADRRRPVRLRWADGFLINLPVGIVASFLAFRYLPEAPKSDRSNGSTSSARC